jgi:hypothetical protein
MKDNILQLREEEKKRCEKKLKHFFEQGHIYPISALFDILLNYDPTLCHDFLVINMRRMIDKMDEDELRDVLNINLDNILH